MTVPTPSDQPGSGSASRLSLEGLSAADLVAALCHDQRQRWRRGERPTVEDYLARYPALRADPEAVRALVLGELALREDCGEEPVVEDLLKRFPQHAEALRRLLQLRQELKDGSSVSTAGAATVGPADSSAGGEGLPPTRAAVTQPAPVVPLPAAEWVAVAGYEVLGRLGKGGMGVVYQARQIGLDRLVALKMILHAEHASSDERERFRTEAQAVARLHHPNIVQIYEVGECQGLPYFSMELCPQGSLADQLDGTPWDAGSAARLVETLARALQAAHAAGIVHRDIKPANVLLAADGTPKVTDFGLARRLDVQGQTRTGVLMGTASYMAPEQARGRAKEAGPAADTYALGAVLYELLTGRPPFKAATDMDTMLQVVSQEPVPLRRLQPRVPRDLETICLQCLQKSPAKRYASALALAEDLRRFAAGEPILARPIGPAERCWRWCRRNPALAVTGGLSALALLALLVLVASFAVYQSWTAEALRVKQQETQDALDEAQKRRHQAELLAVQLSTETGLAFCEKGEVSRGLLWLARSLKDVPPDRPDLKQALQANLVAWQRQIRPLKLMLAHPEGLWLERAVWSPDGRRILAGYKRQDESRGEARIWDAATGQPGPVLPHESPVMAVAFSPDGKTVLTGCLDGTVRRADAATGRLLGPPEKHQDPILCLAFSPRGDTYAAGGKAGGLYLHDAASGRVLGQLSHRNAVLCLAFSPDGSKLLSGSADRFARLWDVAERRLAIEPVAHADQVRAVAFHPAGHILLTGCTDGKAYFWRTSDGKTYRPPLQHQEPVESMAFSPTGDVVLTGTGDHYLHLWDFARGQLRGERLPHFEEVRSAAFSPDGRRILTGCWHEIRVWELSVGEAVLAHPDWVSSVAFNPDGRAVLTGTANVTRLTGEVWLWEAASRKQLGPPLSFGRMVCAVAFSPDGKYFLVGGGHPFLPLLGGEARVYETATRQPASPSLRCGGAVTWVAFDPGGGRFLTASLQDKAVRIWAWPGARLLHTLEHPDWAPVGAFSPDGTTVLTGCRDGLVRQWDPVTGQRKGPDIQYAAPPKDSTVAGLAFSPDGRYAIIGGGEHTARIWDLQSQARGKSFQHNSSVRPVSFSPDGRFVLTGSQDNTARLWDVETGRPIGPPLQHQGWVLGAIFSPDGRTILTGGTDNTARLWAAGLPAEVDAQRIALWIQVTTGKDLDATNAIQVLDVAAWQERQRRLEELGGPPAP
jgi:WD40 repeat protein